MSHSIFPRLLRGLSVGALALSLSAAPLVMSSTAEAQPSVQLTVRHAPPTFRPNVRRPHRPNSRYTWTEGYWTWNGARYVWQPGRWVLARPGHRYQQGRWIHRGNGYTFQAPRWVRGPVARPVVYTRPAPRPAVFVNHPVRRPGVIVNRPVRRPSVVVNRPVRRPTVVVNRPGRRHVGFHRGR